MDINFDENTSPVAWRANGASDDSLLDDISVKSDVSDASDKFVDVLGKEIPANAKDLKSVDSLIAYQMTKLSVNDREKVYMDVHGLAEYYITETSEFLNLSLLGLQNEIDLLPDKKAYNVAEKLSSEYVHDRDFRLAFLRCERFDCPKAALRIVRHFQMKLDLFGMDKLVMDITQDDLDADDMDGLYGATGRFLEKRDSAGRIINLIVSVPRLYKTDSYLRKGFYNIMVAFRDEEVQRRGAVNISLFPDGGKDISASNPDLLWKLPKLNEGSPMRLSAVHHCWSHEIWLERQALIKSALSKPVQVRIRAHHGTVQECLDSLRGHGIDPACVPVDDQGMITDQLDACRRLEAQRTYERLNFPPRSTIHVPFSKDVLIGKGSPFQNHPGNKMFRKFVSDYIKRYDKSRKKEKNMIALEIIESIKQSGGLFLKQDGDGRWNPVDDEVARLKVTAAFRTFRHSLKRKDS